MGQKARFWYAPRPKKEKEDSYVDTDSGVLTELDKQFVSMHKWKRKETIGMNEMQADQHADHKEYLIAEIERLIVKLPTHVQMGIKEGDKARFITAAKHVKFSQKNSANTSS